MQVWVFVLSASAYQSPNCDCSRIADKWFFKSASNWWWIFLFEGSLTYFKTNLELHKYHRVEKVESDFRWENCQEPEEKPQDWNDSQNDVPEPEEEVHFLVDNILSENTKAIVDLTASSCSNIRNCTGNFCRECGAHGIPIKYSLNQILNSLLVCIHCIFLFFIWHIHVKNCPVSIIFELVVEEIVCLDELYQQQNIVQDLTLIQLALANY